MSSLQLASLGFLNLKAFETVSLDKLFSRRYCLFKYIYYSNVFGKVVEFL